MSDSSATPWPVAHQAPLFMGLPRQQYWSGLPFPPPGDLSHPGIQPASPALAGGFFTTEQATREAHNGIVCHKKELSSDTCNNITLKMLRLSK